MAVADAVGPASRVALPSWAAAVSPSAPPLALDCCTGFGAKDCDASPGIRQSLWSAGRCVLKHATEQLRRHLRSVTRAWRPCQSRTMACGRSGICTLPTPRGRLGSLAASGLREKPLFEVPSAKSENPGQTMDCCLKYDRIPTNETRYHHKCRSVIDQLQMEAVRLTKELERLASFKPWRHPHKHFGGHHAPCTPALHEDLRLRDLERENSQLRCELAKTNRDEGYCELVEALEDAKMLLREERCSKDDLEVVCCRRPDYLSAMCLLVRVCRSVASCSHVLPS